LIARITPHLDRSPSALSPIEKALVVIGCWELVNRLEIPYKVVINEAVELAKAYGGTDGHKFVNGVLDKVAADVRAQEIAALARERDAHA
jgi:transcription antitermination protein NusB